MVRARCAVCGVHGAFCNWYLDGAVGVVSVWNSKDRQIRGLISFIAFWYGFRFSTKQRFTNEKAKRGPRRWDPRRIAKADRNDWQ